MMVRSRAGRRIGVFGGTFDPPHIGHLVAAVDARQALDLDVVLLVVANVPWQKVGQPGDQPGRGPPGHGARRRWPMRPASRSATSRSRRGGPSYTADTLADAARRRARRRALPDPGQRRRRRVRHLGALRRGGRDWPTWWWSTGPGTPTPIDDGFDWIRVDIPELEISSTELRQRVADGRSIRYLTPPAVATCISRARALSLSR